MTDHVIMTYIGTVQRMERRNGKSLASGTFRPGVVIIIPAGSSSRWDIPSPSMSFSFFFLMDTGARCDEADKAGLIDLAERTAHPDSMTARLLLSAADVIDGNETLDTFFRQQLTDLLATRLLSAHTGLPSAYQPARAACRRSVLRRAIERLRSDSDADVSLSTLARIPGCRVSISAVLSRIALGFRRITGCAASARAGHEHAARPQNSVATVAAALGYASQTAFAAAFRKLTGETPRIGDGASVNRNRSSSASIALAQPQDLSR